MYGFKSVFGVAPYMLMLLMLLDFPSFTFALYISIFSTLHTLINASCHLLNVF
jgi:hypothetical protein